MAYRNHNQMGLLFKNVIDQFLSCKLSVCLINAILILRLSGIAVPIFCCDSNQAKQANIWPSLESRAFRDLTQIFLSHVNLVPLDGMMSGAKPSGISCYFSRCAAVRSTLKLMIHKWNVESDAVNNTCWIAAVREMATRGISHIPSLFLELALLPILFKSGIVTLSNWLFAYF